MHKALSSILFLVMVGTMQSNCSPVNSFAEYPTQTKPVPQAVTALAPATQVLTESSRENLEEPSLPTVTQAQTLASTDDTFTYLPTVTRMSPTLHPSGLFADHRAVEEFASIPKSFIDAAEAKRVLFYHASTGGNIDFLGLGCLAGLNGDPSRYPPECITLASQPGYYSKANWSWPLWPDSGGPTKQEKFYTLASAQAQNFDILGMKYCYLDSSMPLDFEAYRQTMVRLERENPGKVFVWATAALWGKETSGACQGFQNSCKTLSEFNTQLRAYALANNKPLYDIAAIESNGGVCQTAGYEGLCQEYYDGFGGGEGMDGGHPDIEGSLRLAKGFWWLIAKISGWVP